MIPFSNNRQPMCRSTVPLISTPQHCMYLMSLLLGDALIRTLLYGRLYRALVQSHPSTQFAVRQKFHIQLPLSAGTHMSYARMEIPAHIECSN